jgi:hypothetical protein
MTFRPRSTALGAETLGIHAAGLRREDEAPRRGEAPAVTGTFAECSP